jgi:filamentous hemagglutinin family protein
MIKSKLLLLLLTFIGIAFDLQTTRAQTYQPTNRIPVADNTLGTQVSGTGNNFTITGGLSKGQTTFQSFTDFSVPTNGSANFSNPTGNRDIITRVTGNLFSDINGTVNTNGANFFLINPNGIVFGNNARLNVGKSFVGSTASSLDLVDGSGRTINFGTNQNGDALLRMSPNVLFDASRLNLGGGSGAITNYGTLQTPNTSQYIGLIGGNVTLDGSSGGGKIIAPGGRVDIGGLSSAGSVTIDNNGLVFGSIGVGRSNVLLTNGGGITVRATGTLDTINTFFNNASSNGSSINISTNNLDLLNAGANSSTLSAAIDAGLETNSGVQTQAAGNINIDATGKVSLNNSIIKNTLRSGAEGSIGNINIQAGALDIINSSGISTITAGKGDAGDINIKTTGDLKIASSDLLSTDSTPYISSNTQGQGDTGKISIDTQGKLSIVDGGLISSSIGSTGIGNSKGISITARELELANDSNIFAIASQANRVNGKGNAGDINIKTTGDIKISGSDSPSSKPTISQIASNIYGQGNTGKITIDTQGKLSLINRGAISSGIAPDGVGNSQGISITARELELSNNSLIITNNIFSSARGNAGDINIKTTGDIKISGYDSSSTKPTTSRISSDTAGLGDTGKITIDTQGKLSLIDGGAISSLIASGGIGNSQGISITARELELSNNSFISTNTLISAQGNAGDINIKTTGDIKIFGYDSSLIDPKTSNISFIGSGTTGLGDAGKITLDTQGKLSLFNGGFISSSVESNSIGNSKGIKITAREIELANDGRIDTNTSQTAQVNGKGNAGDIDIKTTGDIKISGNGSSIFSNTQGQGDTGKITIDTQGKLSIADGGIVSSSIFTKGVGNGRGLFITARDIELTNNSYIISITGQTEKVAGTGTAGDINLKAKGTIQVNSSSQIATTSTATGQTGNISIIGERLRLNAAFVNSIGTYGAGGDINIFLSDNLLMQNTSFIASDSGLRGGSDNGGNITINSPLIIALPGNNDITANANGGNGGNLNITSQGLFGINYRAIGSNSTNDITASSTFGQNGAVKIDTPGTDPGKSSTELPQVPTDASNQISQTCSTNNRQNKLTVAGRGGLPPNADDLLTPNIVWRDARATNSQPAISSVTTPALSAPPAVGWVFDGNGKVNLVAAATNGQPTGTSVVCPQAVK